eukprot:CAMPEP_0171457810 /NCGR_PEP_ID=MMETSP0945-20130129/3736_1 /TAXON_ID=109269 /ORGANISM="Vaucheria litorea, Strain CCMP2940" /LENGTH=210 /DNA_ID=CAMNT_0011983485 /DNA_START=206 /DNA_END=838 /DNA_ORIENTATION=+
MEALMENNASWAKKITDKNPNYFKNQSKKHTPKFFFIGCSDARLSIQEMLGLKMGEVFVHRNVGNQVLSTDLNFVSCLHYAVEYLKIENIIVCGHYDCGAVRAAATNKDHGIVQQWLAGIKDLAREHNEELFKIRDTEMYHRKLVELNVQKQVLSLYASPIVQKSHSIKKQPFIHPIVLDIETGLIHEVEIDYQKLVDKFKHIYSMYDFV